MDANQMQNVLLSLAAIQAAKTEHAVYNSQIFSSKHGISSAFSDIRDLKPVWYLISKWLY